MCVLLLSTVANGYGAVTKVGYRALTVLPGGNPTQLYTPFPDYQKEVPGGANPTVTQRVTFSANGRAMAQWVKVGATATLYALYTDHLGSVVAVGTAGGSLVANSYATYQPFGAFVSNPTGTNPSVTDRGFTGHKHNNTGTNNLGLIYMNARYYHPQLGRFVSADTIVPEPGEPQSHNRYSYVNNSPMKYIDPTGHNRDCGMGDSICNGDRSFMAGGWGSARQQGIADPIEGYYASGYEYAPGERSTAVSGGDDHNGVDLISDSTHQVVALSTGIVRVADPCTIDPCNGYSTADANYGTGSVVIVEYPYEVIPDQVREGFGMTSDMSLYVQYQHLAEIAPQIVAGRVVTANDVIGQYGDTGLSRAPHLHFESHVGPSQALGMGGINGAYDSPSNNRNWHNMLAVVDPNVILNNSVTLR